MHTDYVDCRFGAMSPQAAKHFTEKKRAQLLLGLYSLFFSTEFRRMENDKRVRKVSHNRYEELNMNERCFFLSLSHLFTMRSTLQTKRKTNEKHYEKIRSHKTTSNSNEPFTENEMKTQRLCVQTFYFELFIFTWILFGSCASLLNRLYAAVVV